MAGLTLSIFYLVLDICVFAFPSLKGAPAIPWKAQGSRAPMAMARLVWLKRHGWKRPPGNIKEKERTLLKFPVGSGRTRERCPTEQSLPSVRQKRHWGTFTRQPSESLFPLLYKIRKSCQNELDRAFFVRIPSHSEPSSGASLELEDSQTCSALMCGVW